MVEKAIPLTTITKSSLSSENGCALDVFDETIPAKYLEPGTYRRQERQYGLLRPYCILLSSDQQSPHGYIIPAINTTWMHSRRVFIQSESMYEIVKKRKYGYVHREYTGDLEKGLWVGRSKRSTSLQATLPEVYAQQLWGYCELFAQEWCEPEMFLPELSNILYIDFASRTKGGISLHIVGIR